MKLKLTFVVSLMMSLCSYGKGLKGSDSIKGAACLNGGEWGGVRLRKIK